MNWLQISLSLKHKKQKGREYFAALLLSEKPHTPLAITVFGSS